MKHGAKRRFNAGQRVSVLVFLLALPLFAVVLLLPLIKVYSPNTAYSETANKPGKVRSVLLLIHNEENALTGAVSVQIDTVRMRAEVCGYPKQTEVTNGTLLCTLQTCYAALGTKTGERLSAVTGDTYDAVWRLSTDGVGEFVSRLGGGVSYTLPETVGLLGAGEQLLTAQQIAELLRYGGWGKPAEGQAAMHAGIVAAVIDRFLAPSYDLKNSFNALTAVCDDRITIAQFTVVKEELLQLSQANTRGLCRVSVATGEMVGVGENERYVLTE